MRLALLFIFSFYHLISASAQSGWHKQKLKIEAIRIGIDPVRSLSMLAPEKKPDNHLFYFRNIEFHAEAVANMRTSLIVEAGYAIHHKREMNTTLDYFSRGWFSRIGFNYKLTERNSNYDSGIGWRVGVNDFKENSTIRLWGESWNTELLQPMTTYGKSIWGEVLFYHNARLFPDNHPLRNLWYGVDTRIRMGIQKLTTDPIKGYSLPGYGEKKKIMAGVHFRLFYQLQNRELPAKKVKKK